MSFQFLINAGSIFFSFLCHMNKMLGRNYSGAYVRGKLDGATRALRYVQVHQHIGRNKKITLIITYKDQ